ncbi:hypothetical protein CMI37_19485 [Candidatus Pacearchaeota archaeon]|nr:hypothetical protein [Candidatus Pacearchaeota archaeon]
MGNSQFDKQEILNRVLVDATGRLAVNTDVGDGRPKQDNTPQRVWNKVFDSAANVLNLSMS